MKPEKEVHKDAVGDIAKIRPEVKILLDKERTLLLDLNAMVAFENVTGRSLLTGGTLQTTAKDLRALVWACLLHEDKELTEEQVGKWMSLGNMANISQKLGEAFTSAMPEIVRKDISDAEAEVKEDPLANPSDG